MTQRMLNLIMATKEDMANKDALIRELVAILTDIAVRAEEANADEMSGWAQTAIASAKAAGYAALSAKETSND